MGFASRGVWVMGYCCCMGYEAVFPANQLGGLKNVWNLREYGVCIGKLGPNRQGTTKPYKFFQNIKYQQFLKGLQTTFSININGGVVVTFHHVQNNFLPLWNMRWLLTTIKRKRLGEMSRLRRTIGSWQASKESTRDLQHQTRYVVMYFVIFTSAIQTFW